MGHGPASQTLGLARFAYEMKLGPGHMSFDSCSRFDRIFLISHLAQNRTVIYQACIACIDSGGASLH